MLKEVRLGRVFIKPHFLRHVSDGEKSRAAEENIFLQEALEGEGCSDV